MIKCCRMTRDLLPDAFSLLSTYLSQDEYYIESSAAYGDAGNAALFDALELFVEQPSLGFVWLAYESSEPILSGELNGLGEEKSDEPVGVCLISYAISTSMGAIVAKLDDVFVFQDKRGKGIGSVMLKRLKQELSALQVQRIDTSVHTRNQRARQFYEKQGFLPLNEERLSCVL